MIEIEMKDSPGLAALQTPDNSRSSSFVHRPFEFFTLAVWKKRLAFQEKYGDIFHRKICEY